MHPGLLAKLLFIGPPALIGLALLNVSSLTSSSRPASAAAPPIKHIIVMIRENRSFDNIFGQFPGAAGTTYAREGTKSVKMRISPDAVTSFINNGFLATKMAMNGGRMNRFYRLSSAKFDVSDTQYTPKQVANYYKYAQNFGLADHFFSTIASASFPNHLALVAGSSQSVIDNPYDNGHKNSWGCDAAPSVRVAVLKHGGTRFVRPCFTVQTLADEATAAGVSWRYYAAPRNQLGYVWSTLDSVKQIRDNPRVWSSSVVSPAQFDADVASGTLPSLTWLSPPFPQSEHPPYSECQGINWTTDRINAIMKSSLWPGTAIVVVWDDYGGFYDHVKPPRTNALGFGPRVPMLLISPFTKPHTIYRGALDYRSIVQFVESNFGLKHMAAFSRTAGNLWPMLDLNQKPNPPLTLSDQTCPSNSTKKSVIKAALRHDGLS